MSEFKKPSTPKRKREHLAELEKILMDAGFKQDRWNNWAYPGFESRFRVKFKDVNVRFEKKFADKWHSLTFNSSFVISQKDPIEWKEDVQKLIQRFK